MIVKRKRKPRPLTEEDKPSRRVLTDAIIETVHYAKGKPGEWCPVPHLFKRSNAHSTASCVRRGFLRVKPKPGEQAVTVGEHTYLKLPAKCEVEVRGNALWLRVPLRVPAPKPSRRVKLKRRKAA